MQWGCNARIPSQMCKNLQLDLGRISAYAVGIVSRLPHFTYRLLWIALALTLLCAAGRAQTETILYNFTRLQDLSAEIMIIRDRILMSGP